MVQVYFCSVVEGYRHVSVVVPEGRGGGGGGVQACLLFYCRGYRHVSVLFRTQACLCCALDTGMSLLCCALDTGMYVSVVLSLGYRRVSVLLGYRLVSFSL